jgi:hypothetical protein
MLACTALTPGGGGGTVWLPLDFSQDVWRQRKDLNVAFPRIVDMVCSDVRA